MKKLFTVVVAAMIALPVVADNTQQLQDEIRLLKAQLQKLEARMNAQSESQNRLEAQALQMEQRALQMEEDSLSMLESFAQLKAVSDAISISGNIDIVAHSLDADFDTSSDEDQEDIYLDQFTLKLEAQINDNVSGVIGLRIEETGLNTPGLVGATGGALASVVASSDTESGGNENVQLEQAYITITGNDGLSLTAGKQYMPFGNYATNFIDDPLTQALGEARDTGLVVGWTNDEGLSLSGFWFNGPGEQVSTNGLGPGDIDDNNEVDTWGASLVYTSEQEDMTMSFGLGYINNILQAVESYTLSGTGGTFGHEVDAINAFLTLQNGPFWMSSEIVHAIRSTDPATDLASDTGNSREPVAYTVELGFDVEAMDREWTLMAKWEDAEEISTGTGGNGAIQHKWGVGVATELYTNTKLTLNYENQRHDISGMSAGQEDGTLQWLAAELSVSF